MHNRKKRPGPKRLSPEARKGDRVIVLCTSNQRRKLFAAADVRGQGFSEWARSILLAAAERALR